MEVYLFGASALGERALKNLKNKYKIKAFLDNDCNKWNSKIDGVDVLNPKNVKNSNSKIEVIITSAYYLQIIDQLIEMGIDDIKIYFENSTMDSFYIEEVKIEKEFKKSESNILLLLSFYSIYIHEYIKQLEKTPGIKFDIATRDKEYFNKLNDTQIGNIYYYNNYNDIKRVILNGNYNIIHLHYMESVYVPLSEIIQKNCSKFIITYWGSDYYRISKNDKNYQKELLLKADNITFDNKKMMRDFCLDIGEELYEKCKLIRFGLTELDYIDLKNKQSNCVLESKESINRNKFNIICGYNSKEAQNHISIFEEFMKLNDEIKNKIHIIIPMTYGSCSKDYKCNVENKIRETNISYTLLKDFMNFEQMADLITNADIMVHVQTTDSLSATMLENLYAGNIVINGAWLPYDELIENNIYFRSIRSIDNINEELTYIIENYQSEKGKCVNNHSKIHSLSSWESNISKWLKLYCD